VFNICATFDLTCVNILPTCSSLAQLQICAIVRYIFW